MHTQDWVLVISATVVAMRNLAFITILVFNGLLKSFWDWWSISYLDTRSHETYHDLFHYTINFRACIKYWLTVHVSCVVISQYVRLNHCNHVFLFPWINFAAWSRHDIKTNIFLISQAVRLLLRISFVVEYPRSLKMCT